MRDGVMTEADTCREFVTPKLVEAGGANAPTPSASNAASPTAASSSPGGKVRRGKQKRADYLLYYRRDYPWPSWKPRKSAYR
jgi:type I restriction enzyme R subunit